MGKAKDTKQKTAVYLTPETRAYADAFGAKLGLSLSDSANLGLALLAVQYSPVLVPGGPAQQKEALEIIRKHFCAQIDQLIQDVSGT